MGLEVVFEAISPLSSDVCRRGDTWWTGSTISHVGICIGEVADDQRHVRRICGEMVKCGARVVGESLRPSHLHISQPLTV